MEKLIEMYVKMRSQMQSMVRDEKGATMVEYALMIALIAVVCVATVTSIGTGADNKFKAILASLGVAG